MAGVVPTLAPLIVRTGSITLGVARDRVVSTFNRVSALAIALGGFVQSSTSGSPQPVPLTANTPAIVREASLVVRVPTRKFGLLDKEVATLGRVQSESLVGTDVTGESINLKARIQTSQGERKVSAGLHRSFTE
ncbi:MAG: DUF4349 domain-containing protein [Acidimicrobiales bacterium]